MSHDGIPYLIQRVSRREHISEHSKGFDRIFSLDYMGSAEFEFGTIPKALKAMRAAKDETWRIRPIMASSGETCYYVGSKDRFNVAIQVFEDELKPTYSERQFRHKERTAIYESYHPVKGKNYNLFDAWWAVDEDLAPFFLFKNKKHAQELLDLL